MTDEAVTDTAGTSHQLTVEVTVVLTDEDALVEFVRSETPEGSLSPDDIREEDRAAASVVAGVSKALRALSIPGVEIREPQVSRTDA